MLKVYLGPMNNVIYNPQSYFDYQYEDWWITTPFCKRIVEDIDKSKVLSEKVIDSPFIGPIPPVRLSGGVKTLLLINFDDSKIYNASACGDNCAKYLLAIGKQRDITINLNHVMEFGLNPFEMLILNNEVVVHDMIEFLKAGGKFL